MSLVYIAGQKWSFLVSVFCLNHKCLVYISGEKWSVLTQCAVHLRKLGIPWTWRRWASQSHQVSHSRRYWAVFNDSSVLCYTIWWKKRVGCYDCKGMKRSEHNRVFHVTIYLLAFVNKKEEQKNQGFKKRKVAYTKLQWKIYSKDV